MEFVTLRYSIIFNLEGQQLRKGPQLLTTDGAQGQVEVDKAEKSGKLRLNYIPTLKNPVVM